jgi:class 3 adenylate cyclase
MLDPNAQPADVTETTDRTAAQWLEAVKDAERRGELLLAVDLAERGLAQHPQDLWLRHRAVLALARSGSTQEAARRFAAYGLVTVEEEDVAALGARIAKDEALTAEGSLRQQRAAAAAEAYRRIFSRTGGYYPAINAATLNLLAGNADRAEDLARDVLKSLEHCEENSYYAAATEAEAELVLGEESRARDALERAVAVYGGDYGALATTRRQLRTICGIVGIDTGILSILSGPAVAHYCGHRISAEGKPGRFRAESENEIAVQMAKELARHPVAYAYGSLASGADILWAEALLAQGCELHVVLPFALDEFVRCSVAPAGPDWKERFYRCLAAARDVRYATDDAFLDDDVLHRYGAELAMGLTLLRARYLDADAHQFALWDGRPPGGKAGTAIDVETWRRQGRPASIIPPTSITPSALDESSPGDLDSASRRVVRAMLFADIQGFSKLKDEELPRFARRVLGAFAETLDRHSDAVEHRNTWGDALYVVLSDATTAAACALDLQGAMGEIDFEAEGLPGHLALRLGGHLGPVFPTQDPVIDEVAFLGSHVSRTARIEPVTPPGVVYVTEPFAAALALAGPEQFICDYVGHMPAAKDFGRLRMYRLWRRTGDRTMRRRSQSADRASG